MEQSFVKRSDAWSLLSRNIAFYQQVMSETERALAHHGLDVKSFFLLAAVEEIHYPAELAQHLLIPKPTVTFLVKRMEAAGYLTRATVPGDLRKFRLQLTREGRKVVEVGKQIVSRSFEAHLARLTTRERESYESIIDKLAQV